MCNCIEKYKQDLALIKKLAKKFTNIIQDDVRVYSKPGKNGLIYDFEPVFAEINIATEIYIIKYNNNFTTPPRVLGVPLPDKSEGN